MKRYIVGVLLLTSISSIATAQPFTRRSSQEQHDALKKYYEISDFRLGGRYDLANPSKWENGGEGGKTLESLGGGKLRTAYIGIATPRRNAAGEITNAVIVNSYYSGDSTDMYEQWVKGAALSGGVPIIGPGRPIDTDRYYVVMVDPLGTWGASKPSDGLGTKFPLFPAGLRVIGIDWRGCGDSDHPPPTKDYANYSMQQHALDMLAALDALKIPFCHLATHSTGGIIAARMLLMQPHRFGRVITLDPVTPLGMFFNAEQIGLFRAMMASREVTRAVVATAASSLFAPESLAPNAIPRFRRARSIATVL